MFRPRHDRRGDGQRNGLTKEPIDISKIVTGAERVHCKLDELLADRKLTLVELSERVGVTVVNLSILKNDHGRAIRFSTLVALCDALDVPPGDLFWSTHVTLPGFGWDADGPKVLPYLRTICCYQLHRHCAV